jgi:hypothetical protein
VVAEEVWLFCEFAAEVWLCWSDDGVELVAAAELVEALLDGSDDGIELAAEACVCWSGDAWPL